MFPYFLITFTATCLLCLIAWVAILIWDDIQQHKHAAEVEEDPPCPVFPLAMYRQRRWVDTVRAWEHDHPDSA